MEKGIAGLEIKPGEKESDPAFRTGVKKKRKDWRWGLFRFIFCGKELEGVERNGAFGCQ